ncbi:MAG: carboxymuconolactone decarboxylase family protein [Verrucomicrobiota bacterium JB022]|nr:carboxymuconolactone decarboxylase family protein [Verrucomicrobiota bacterium JB022]
MENTTNLLKTLPEEAKDLRLNLKNLLEEESLTPAQRWGVALASAYFVGNGPLIDALSADFPESQEVHSDAKAAASIMGMNTVYYRFRHLMNSEAYNQRPARLRMQRMSKVATNKADFELMSLACAALAGCEMCLKAHEKIVKDGGLGEDHIHDAVRLAAVVSGVAVALNTARA